MSDRKTILGHSFRDPELLRLALTHRSIGSPNNQRLEFLGDAVLEYLVSRMLFDRYPNADEGDLTARRISLVCEETLSVVARREHLGEALQMSPGALQQGGREKPSVLCDTFEAVLAAIYLDGGIEAADQAVRRCLPSPEEAPRPIQSPKSALQEWTQRGGGSLPVYTLLERSGPPHKPVFQVSVSLNGRELARGTGSSKQLAEQTAAEEALRVLQRK